MIYLNWLNTYSVNVYSFFENPNESGYPGIYCGNGVYMTSDQHFDASWAALTNTNTTYSYERSRDGELSGCSIASVGSGKDGSIGITLDFTNGGTGQINIGGAWNPGGYESYYWSPNGDYYHNKIIASAAGQGGINVDKVVGYVGAIAATIDYTYTANEVLKEISTKAVNVGAKTGKVLGSAGYVAAGASTYINYRSMNDGEISTSLFSYRTVGTGVAIGVGIYVGAVPAALVGGSVWVGEQMYNGVSLAIDKINQFCNDFNTAVSSGKWYPGKR